MSMEGEEEYDEIRRIPVRKLTSMGEINPYELLGVTPSSTLQEVKKAFGTLSRIMHPDKGGNANDMMILQYAYDYVSEQIKWALTASTSQELKSESVVNRLERSFKEFCLSQEETESEFNFSTTTNSDNFNLLYDQLWKKYPGNIWHASYRGGYDSEITAISEDNNLMMMSDVTYDPMKGLEPAPKPFPSQLVIYQEPESYATTTVLAPMAPTEFDVLNRKIEDYGQGTDLSDYKRAYTVYEMKDFRTTLDPLPSIETILRDRESVVLAFGSPT